MPDLQPQLAQAVKHLKENLPALIEMAQIRATCQWQHFKALKANGFSADEALKIVSLSTYP